MTENEFNKLSIDLQSLARIVPLNWGFIQNNDTDSKIKMFEINSFDELESKISQLSDNDKNYFRRRWFIWKCAQCDEYIFNINTNVVQNPNSRDQDYDIEFNKDEQLRFDLKGTVIPKKFRNEIDKVLENPTEMIQYFYEEQSGGIRYKNQNRLFIVHHSYRKQEREMYLRCVWEHKIKFYREYASKINNTSNFIEYKLAKSDVIFILENLDKSISYKFFSIR